MGLPEYKMTSPLRYDAEGTMRIGETRVTVDTLLAFYHQGFTPEEIAHSFPTLQLADVYATISIYLRNQQSMDVYLQTRREQAETFRKAHPQDGIRERLLQRGQMEGTR